MNPEHFLVQSGRRQGGPYLAGEIVEMRATGALTGAETIRSVTGAAVSWEAARQLARSHSASATAPTAPSISSATALDPFQLALLGVIFTPIWSAAMGVANARRLGLASHGWTTLGVAIAWLAADLAIAFSPLNWWPFRVVLLTLALWLVWRWGLREQCAAARVVPRPPRHAWVVPLAASALGLGYTTSQYVVMPLRPIPADLVCERMICASNAQRSGFLTDDLMSQVELIHWLSAQARDSYVFSYGYVVRDGGASPAGQPGQCCVDFTFRWRDRSGERLCAGFFTLRSAGRTWRIKDLHVTQIDETTSMGNILEADNAAAIRELLDDTTPIPPPAWTRTVRPPRDLAAFAQPKKESLWQETKERPGSYIGLANFVRFMLTSGGGKKLFAAIVLLIMGKAAYDRWRGRGGAAGADEKPPTSDQ
jgi:hypothetical protein